MPVSQLIGLAQKRCSFLLASILFSFLLIAAAENASAEGRVALVIGNSNYGDTIGRLKNPANDATLIATTLEGLGFTVAKVIDGDRATMRQAIRNFGKALVDAGTGAIGFFYYAGHGVQIQGENFLIPVGADIENEADVEDSAVSADYVLRQMEYAGNAVNLVFLDACRNNPLMRGFRSAERGLARVEGPTGSFIGYSTAPGDVAMDGDGVNSPYATALAQELSTSNEDIQNVHIAVRAAVMQATAKQQVPWDTSSLTGKVVLANAPAEPKADPAQPTAVVLPGADKEAMFWESIKDSTDAALFAAYLAKYPDGTFVPIAEAKIAALKAAAATPEAARVLEPLAVDEMDASFVTRQSANVRAAPSTDAAIIEKLKEDEAVLVTGKVAGKDWYRVQVESGSGYVSSKLLSAADADEIAAWRKAKAAGGADALDAFLKQYPNSPFKEKATALLAQRTPAAPAAAVQPQTPPPAAPATTATGTQIQKGAPGALAQPGQPGWSQELTAGCWVWAQAPQPSETFRWSGRCDQNGLATGSGTLDWSNSYGNNRYQGPLVAGKASGQGNASYANGNRYEGSWSNGYQNGQGRFTYADGAVYVGGFLNDKANGHGSVTSAGGDKYDGEWRNGLAEGKGSMVFADGRRYDGMWRNNLADGQGTMTYPNGGRYSGGWRANLASGQGEMLYPDGKRYIGSWSENWQHGQGEAIVGGVSYRGTWTYGCLWQNDVLQAWFRASEAECRSMPH